MAKTKGKIGHNTILDKSFAKFDKNRIACDADVPGLIIVAKEGQQVTDPKSEKSFYYNNERITEKDLANYWDGPRDREDPIRSNERLVDAVRDFVVNEKGADRIKPYVIPDPQYKDLHYDVHFNGTITAHIDNKHESYEESKIASIAYDDSRVNYQGKAMNAFRRECLNDAFMHLHKYGEMPKRRKHENDISAFNIGYDIRNFCYKNRDFISKYLKFDPKGPNGPHNPPDPPPPSGSAAVAYEDMCEYTYTVVGQRFDMLDLDVDVYRKNDAFQARFVPAMREEMIIEGHDALYDNTRVNADQYVPGLMHILDQNTNTVFSAYKDTKLCPMDPDILRKTVEDTDDAKSVKSFIVPDPEFEGVEYEIYANGDVRASNHAGDYACLYRNLGVIDYSDSTEEDSVDHFRESVRGFFDSINAKRREEPLKMDYDRIRADFDNFQHEVERLTEDSKGSNRKHNQLVDIAADRFKTVCDNFHKDIQSVAGKNFTREIPSIDTDFSDDEQYGV